jgi:hypothetical protein
MQARGPGEQGIPRDGGLDIEQELVPGVEAQAGEARPRPPHARGGRIRGNRGSIHLPRPVMAEPVGPDALITLAVVDDDRVGVFHRKDIPSAHGLPDFPGHGLAEDGLHQQGISAIRKDRGLELEQAGHAQAQQPHKQFMQHAA